MSEDNQSPHITITALLEEEDNDVADDGTGTVWFVPDTCAVATETATTGTALGATLITPEEDFSVDEVAGDNCEPSAAAESVGNTGASTAGSSGPDVCKVSGIMTGRKIGPTVPFIAARPQCSGHAKDSVRSSFSALSIAAVCIAFGVIRGSMQFH